MKKKNTDKILRVASLISCFAVMALYVYYGVIDKSVQIMYSFKVAFAGLALVLVPFLIELAQDIKEAKREKNKQLRKEYCKNE